MFDGPDPAKKAKGSKRPDFIFAKIRRNAIDGDDTVDILTSNLKSLSLSDTSTHIAQSVEYTIWELKKAWRGSEDQSSFQYCINTDSRRVGEEIVEQRKGYWVVKSNNLDKLIARADSQAKGYADKLAEHVPQGSHIHIRSVVGVIEGEENPKLLQFIFGSAQQTHPAIETSIVNDIESDHIIRPQSNRSVNTTDEVGYANLFMIGTALVGLLVYLFRKYR